MRKASLAMGLLATVIAGLAYLYVGNRAALLEKQAAIDSAWEQAAMVIAARSELVPPLAETVRQHAPGQYVKLMRLVEARAVVEIAPTRGEKIEASMQLTAALADLLKAAADDAALKLDASFRRLQDQFADAENRMAVGRRRYNEAVQDYNTSIQLFPNNMVATLAGFAREEAYFRSTEKDRLAAPPVKFSQEEPALEEEQPLKAPTE